MLAPTALCGAEEPLERFSLALYGGFRDGGTFQDADTDSDLHIEGSAAFSAAMEYPLDGGRRLQFLFSFQHTDLDLSASGAVGSDPRLPMRVMYLHVGGPVYFNGNTRHGGYVVGGVGATLFSPAGEYSDELRASANAGLGFQQALGRRLSMRFEARAYYTLLNSSGGMFCSGGCLLAIRGDGTVQGEISVGLVLHP